MKAYRVLVALMVGAAAVSFNTAAEDLTAEKKADIEQVLQMTGALAIGKQMAVYFVGALTQEIRKTRPDIPQKALDTLPEEVGAAIDANIAAFRNLAVPIYHKHFTGAEVKEMIRFYSTDLGKKLIRVSQALMQESMAAGQRWGESLGPEIDARVKARLRKEGVKL